ncbi:MAG: ead/Ea22-like family protein [Pseudomonas helleri]|uniref:ead/Ea22-like family protein n=1 Tax=Pseudomonas helleri TaxID=1608996 RepID=UPI003F94583A
MTDHSELKRLAEAATPGPWYQHGGIMQVLSHDCETVCETFEDDGECPDAQFIAAANPAAVLALIAENERLKNRLEVDPRHDYDGISTRDATVKVLDEQVDQLKAENERLEVEVKRMTSIAYAAHGAFRMETMAERDQLRAEVAGLRTGYEAYERVNAELKAEVEELRKSLLDAAEEIDAWGSYASDYFQEKHDLAGCVAKFHAAAMGKGEQP